MFHFFSGKSGYFFDFNKANPNSNSIQVLNEWIKQNPTAEVYKMEGYCDTVDSKMYNLKLAERRIHTVETILKLNKIKILEKLERIPFGEEFDFLLNQDENRKVSIFYQITSINSFSEKVKKMLKWVNF
ncbi:hypothetical protein H9X57_16325 [Flavobacterium piscinae]|uniref:OmpA family protein n=1 Tax=Flavobacterium piscinae TaxID=2506424 RepID=UPI0019C5CFAE|nr:hypothetical protein [Flavobacterium piscinae]MBC8884371.1 hypothetical protein [Flavobacterium piscinae]